jgi:hypothetical protein
LTDFAPQGEQSALALTIPATLGVAVESAQRRSWLFKHEAVVV